MSFNVKYNFLIYNGLIFFDRRRFIPDKRIRSMILKEYTVSISDELGFGLE